MGLVANECRDLTQEEYETIRRLIYDKVGINLGPQKMQLVRARLGKRIRQGGYRSFGEYFSAVRDDRSGQELINLIDSISTNTTHLFRERQHFDFLTETLQRWLQDAAWRRANSELRIWSAACSSGEEPHTLAMVCDAALASSRVPFRILATDISTRVLAKAQAAEYTEDKLTAIPPEFRRRYFVGRRGAATLQLKPELLSRISFARLNLMDDRFPFKRGFHFIFCRNVMIYFDRDTQSRLVNKQAAHLLKGGYLIIGHSESLNAIKHDLAYERPTVYQKR